MSDYNITSVLPYVTALHNGKTVLIRREENAAATLRADYALTARKCPPYCIQPITLAPGVTTLGELEVIEYIENICKGDNTCWVIDSRTADWYDKGTIPGAINVQFAQNSAGVATDLPAVKASFSALFDVQLNGPTFDFSHARTLVIFCNGPWCGQTPNYIRTLLQLGYPAEKLKWYRGGMQDWCALGLTII
jgi:rhodanese-related sulfurtransferase